MRTGDLSTGLRLISVENSSHNLESSAGFTIVQNTCVSSRLP